MNQEEFNEWENSKKVIVTSIYGFSYSKSDLESTPVSDIIAGHILNFLK